jgi:hypothetical protein
MRTPILAAAIAVLAVAGGAAYYGLQIFPGREFRSGLDQALASLPPGTTASYKDAKYSPVTRQAVLTGFAMHGQIAGQTPVPFDLTVDEVETTNANLDFTDAWAKAAANPAALQPDAALAVADAVTLKGVTIRSAAINATEQSISISKPRLYPWALLHPGLPSWSDLTAAVTPRDKPPTVADMEPILRAEAAIILGAGYDAYQGGAIKGTETLPNVEISFEARAVSGNGFDRGIISGGMADGITVTGDKVGAFSADHVSVGGTNIREPMTRIMNGEAPAQGMLNGVKIGKIEYAGVTAQPPGAPATHIGDVSVGPLTFSQGLPVAGEMSLKELIVSRAQMPDARARDIFEKLGLEKMTVSLALSYNLDTTEQHASLHDSLFKVNELGSLALSADATNTGISPATLTQARLAFAKARFDDASLTDRLLRLGAERSGVAPEAFRRQIADMAMQRSAMMSNGNPLILAAGKAVSDFILSPHSLTVELSPPAPVPLMALRNAAADPGALANVLGLAVIANQK